MSYIKSTWALSVFFILAVLTLVWGLSLWNEPNVGWLCGSAILAFVILGLHSNRFTRQLGLLQAQMQEQAHCMGAPVPLNNPKAFKEMQGLQLFFNNILQHQWEEHCRQLDMVEELKFKGKEVSQTLSTLSHGASEQASNLSNIGSSMREMNEIVAKSSEHSSEANQLSEKVKDDAHKGNKSVLEMVRAMSDIESASKSISKIISVIDGIAFQTNLLALNAAVEAARAGVHGKGFAVVAEEVRNLAARSAKAAKETNDLIANSVSKVELGTDIAKKTALAFEQIVTGISRVTELNGQINVSSTEQSQGIQRIQKSLADIGLVMNKNSGGIEQSANACHQLVQKFLDLEPQQKSNSHPKVSSSPREVRHRSRETNSVSVPQRQLAPQPVARPSSQQNFRQRPLSNVEKMNPQSIIPLDDQDMGRY